MPRYLVPVRWRLKRGFTLIELLVVIAIIGVLVGLLLPAVQKVREAANRMKCQNNLKQLGIAMHAYHDVSSNFPRGNIGTWGNDHGSWLFTTLPYMEQDNLYKQVTSVKDGAGNTYSNTAWNMQAAVDAGILPKKLPYSRCPSDGYDANNPAYSNYVGSQGPQCNDGSCSPRADPFELNCNGVVGSLGANLVPAALNPPTWPGYAPSVVWGNTSNASLCRGMMCRGDGSIGGPQIGIAGVTDGTSNTIMLGETLVEQNEFQRFGNSWGWAGFNTVSQGQTIQPINWPIDGKNVQPASVGWSSCSANCTALGVKPENCIWNWHVTWGFKSNHSGGANFVFADGSVHFIAQSVNTQAYQYLGGRDDGQVINNLPF